MKASQKQLATVAAVTATAGLAGVTLDEFHGRVKVYILHAASGAAGATITAKLQHRNGTDAWEDVAGATFAPIVNTAGVKEIETDSDSFKDEVRLHCTVVGAANAQLGAIVVGRKQYGL